MDRNPGILISQSLENFRRTIGRAVIDDDQFKTCERLLANALDRLRNILLRVVNGHDDGDAR